MLRPVSLISNTLVLALWAREPVGLDDTGRGRPFERC